MGCADLVEAYHHGRFGFLISVKDPYAWAVSIGKFYSRFPTTSQDVSDDRQAAEWLGKQCHYYNHCYRRWLDCYHANEACSMIVRIEDLLADTPGLVRALCSHFDVSQAHARVLLPWKTVGPTQWDHVPSVAGVWYFKPENYQDKRYMNRLTPRLRDVVENEIDWELTAALGYRIDRS